MTTASEDREAASPAPGGLSRRTLLVMALATAGSGATALVARPSSAQATGFSLVGPTPVDDDTVSTRPDVVGDWHEEVVAASPPSPGRADRVWAISWVSALGALDAGTDQRLSPQKRPRFEDAAVATAVHDVLAALVPDRASRLDVALVRSLAAIPDGDAKQAGIQAGQDAAARTLDEREGDGLDPASINIPFTPPPEAPGVFRLPPGAAETNGAGLGQARPFLLDRADRFRPGAPPPPGTDDYRRDLQEVQRLGRVDAPERTDLQSDLAWMSTQLQYAAALDPLVRGPGRSVQWKVRLLAAFTTATIDSQIAVAEAKFAYLHWRPVTAIRTADTDGDPLTRPDPSWSSHLPTPSNPEWPSGDPGYAAAAEHVLEHFNGPRTPVPFTVTITQGDGQVVSHTYRRGTRWSTLTQDIIDARVWAGAHFRFSSEAGATLGRRVAGYDLQRLDPARR